MGFSATPLIKEHFSGQSLLLNTGCPCSSSGACSSTSIRIPARGPPKRDRIRTRGRSRGRSESASTGSRRSGRRMPSSGAEATNGIRLCRLKEKVKELAPVNAPFAALSDGVSLIQSDTDTFFNMGLPGLFFDFFKLTVCRKTPRSGRPGNQTRPAQTEICRSTACATTAACQTLTLSKLFRVAEKT